MFTLFCLVIVTLKKLFINVLKCCYLVAYRPQCGRIYYQADLMASMCL
jgi:hypothetical protein